MHAAELALALHRLCASLAQEFLLELADAGLVQLVAGNGCLALGIPGLDVRELGQVVADDVDGGNGGQQTDVSQGQVLAGRVRLALQEGVQEAEGGFQFLLFLWVGWCLGEQLRIVVVGEACIQRAQVEVQALVDDGPGLGIAADQRVGFAVFVGQITDDGTRLPQGEAIIGQGWDGMLWIHLLFGWSANNDRENRTEIISNASRK